MSFAPVIIFCYNRPDHLRRTVQALAKNPESSQTDLLIYSDAPRSAGAVPGVAAVRSYLPSITGFQSVSIVERETNWGIERSVVDAIHTVGKRFGRFIIVEDDVVTSVGFLRFMNTALELFADSPEVTTVSGFNYPESLYSIPSDFGPNFFFARRNCSYGWASWYSKLNEFEWNFSALCHSAEGTSNRRLVSSYGDDLLVAMDRYRFMPEAPWDYTICLNQILRGEFTVFPTKSLVDNIGFDNTGIHPVETTLFSNSTLAETVELDKPLEVREAPFVRTNLQKIYKASLKTRLFVFLNRRLLGWGFQLLSLGGRKK